MLSCSSGLYELQSRKDIILPTLIPILRLMLFGIRSRGAHLCRLRRHPVLGQSPTGDMHSTKRNIGSGTMDILEKYKGEHPEAFRPRENPGLASDEYGFLIKLAIRMPGGFVRNARQASRVLLGAAVLLIVVSLSVFFWRGSGPELPSEGEIVRDTPTSGLRGEVPR